jgi:hypothetical protein
MVRLTEALVVASSIERTLGAKIQPWQVRVLAHYLPSPTYYAHDPVNLDKKCPKRVCGTP